MRAIGCIDCDAYFSSIEQRDHPELKGKPVIVGSPPNKRGVVSTCSYEARKFGVRSAMPSSVAKQKCPDAIFLPPRIDYYQEVTDQIMQVLGKFSPTIERVSIDEAYFDLTEACLPASSQDDLLYKALPVAREIKGAILAETQLTVSIGIAFNKFLAKVGSDVGKPNGLIVIPEKDKVTFLRDFPVRTIYGVGEVTEEILLKAGLKTIGDVQDYRGDLRQLVGSWAPTLRKFALGEDDRPLDLSDEVKSISTEETFEQDTDDRKVLKQYLLKAAGEIAGQLTTQKLGACTVQVRVRYGDFTTLTRQITVGDPTNSAREIYRLGCFLLAKHRLVCRPLRLLGLGVSHLVDNKASQIPLNLG
jgi:DNA polymerase-4